MKEEIYQNIIDTPETKTPKTSLVKEMIIWWEKKRLIYNALIIGLSVFFIYNFWDYPLRLKIGTSEIIWDTLVFVIVANLFYTSSWGLGIISHYVFKTKGLNNVGKWVLFVLGTLFSLVWTSIYFIFLFDVLFAD